MIKNIKKVTTFRNYIKWCHENSLPVDEHELYNFVNGLYHYNCIYINEKKESATTMSIASLLVHELNHFSNKEAIKDKTISDEYCEYVAFVDQYLFEKNTNMLTRSIRNKILDKTKRCYEYDCSKIY